MANDTGLGRLLLTAGLVASLAGCAGPGAFTRAPAPTGSAIAHEARDLLGAPYRYGGTDPAGFDCSGLVHYAHRQAGIATPRTTRAQFRRAQRVKPAQLRPGDVLFFRLQQPRVSHVAIYIDNGRFIHAPTNGKFVSYASLQNAYWRDRLVAAGRLY